MKRSSIVLLAAAIVIASFFGYSIYHWGSSLFTKSDQIEQTLAIIKPDAVAAMQTGKIIDLIEHAGFTIIDMRKMNLTNAQIEQLYAQHKGKDFFGQLVNYMSEGPVVIMILEKLNAISQWRNFIGNADPQKAADGSLRKLFGANTTRNAVHGSDSQQAAQREIDFFFGKSKK